MRRLTLDLHAVRIHTGPVGPIRTVPVPEPAPVATPRRPR